MKLATGVFLSIAVSGVVLSVGCGSKWQAHEDVHVPSAKMFSDEAPEWVRRGAACMEGIDPTRLYFVGRSHVPDIRSTDYGHDNDRVSAERVGFTVLDERDAVQSARTDVYDQIRQRLSPRNYGMAAQTVAMSIDNGQCLDCGDEVPLLRTPNELPCNDTCSRSNQTSCGRGECGSSSPASSGAMASFPSASPELKGCCGKCSKGETVVNRMLCSFRKPDYLPVDVGQLGRDINLLNIGIDSVMPAMLAAMEEEEVYFEKWNVHEGHDSMGRGLATGDDEWQSYKAWVLFSIPREEYAMIASEFRIQYNALFNRAMEFALADRAKRLELEEMERRIQLEWQKQERAWNREDEVSARDHAIRLDFDRLHFPGRRFSVVGTN